MPSGRKGPERRGGGGGSGTAALCPPSVLSRTLCCVGALVLFQNLALLLWGSRMLSGCLARVDVPLARPSPPPPPCPDALQTGGSGSMQDKLMAQQAALVQKDRHIADLEQQAGQLVEAVNEQQSDAAQAREELLAVKAYANSQGAQAGPARPPPPPPPPGQPPAPLVLTHTAVLPERPFKPFLSSADAAVDADGRPTSRQFNRETSLFSVPRGELRLFGHEVPRSVQITVGMGSVKRKKDYVLDTIGTMLGIRGADTMISPEERAQVVLVVHLSDFDAEWVSKVSARLQGDYSELVNSGHFHGIHAAEELYPKLDICPPFCSYKDDGHRVKWRSKQNVDYAFLMYYAANLSPYYLQVEDDIAFTSGWIGKMTHYLQETYPPGFLSKENTPWRLIDFSQLGFIGKMFQSDELTRLAQFLLLFYDQMPCDLLLGEWMKSMTQGKKIEYWKQHESLFQHVGIFRSLGGFQPLQEKKFGKAVFDNPPGQAHWNMTLVPTYDGKFIYFPGGEPEGRNDQCDFKASNANNKAKIKRCWFWAKDVHRGDHMTIVFEKEVDLKAVFIEFGHSSHAKDLLAYGSVQVAAAAPQNKQGIHNGRDETRFCGKFFFLANVRKDQMVYWEIGASEPAELPVPKVKCLRVAADAAQKEWAVILQVQVRTVDI